MLNADDGKMKNTIHRGGIWGALVSTEALVANSGTSGSETMGSKYYKLTSKDLWAAVERFKVQYPGANLSFLLTFYLAPGTTKGVFLE